VIDITKDIQPLTTFRNNSVKVMQQLKKTKRPIILTVNGKPEAVVQDAAAYQRLLDLAARADANEGIRQGPRRTSPWRRPPSRRVLQPDAQKICHISLEPSPVPNGTWKQSFSTSVASLHHLQQNGSTVWSSPSRAWQSTPGVVPQRLKIPACAISSTETSRTSIASSTPSTPQATRSTSSTSAATLASRSIHQS
jgi:prevent-host-death family protein